MQQFHHTPAMVRPSHGDGRRPLHPFPFAFADVQGQAQALVIGAEVVHTAHQEHAGLHGVRLAAQPADEPSRFRSGPALGGAAGDGHDRTAPARGPGPGRVPHGEGHPGRGAGPLRGMKPGSR